MNKRGQRLARRKWDDATRVWAYGAARDLVLAMASEQSPAAVPYVTGLVPEQGERLWAQSYVQFVEASPPRDRTASPSSEIRPWLATSSRIVGRLSDDRLSWWRWTQVVGCQVKLAPGAELLTLDLTDGSTVGWIGAGIPPLAVVALWHIYGPRSLVEHPGVAVLRAG